MNRICPSSAPIRSPKTAMEMFVRMRAACCRTAFLLDPGSGLRRERTRAARGSVRASFAVIQGEQGAHGHRRHEDADDQPFRHVEHG